ncbi:MAG TPA: phenylalanine--tRNA ligase subunit beta [Clostridia bacterium]|nr:phenylalanine--tRNA ligase subunit beta [Clostridia bacterium]
MILSKKWLNDYVKINVSDKEFADTMTMTGSKVEGYCQEGAQLKNIVVGKVVSLEVHPDSDHMWVCKIEIGENKTVQIVSGAQNLKVDVYVPVALDNSVVFGGQEIKACALRGVESYGMLCSLAELGLTVHDFPNAISDGIFILDDDCDKTLGMDIRQSIGLNDVVTEFEITPNRPDCLSVVGLAREAAASFNVSLNVAKPAVKPSKGDVSKLLKVRIDDSEKCSRYIGAVVENVRIAPSPLWLRERLRASGVRPINNIVDITNYVMLEYGQPMHAFDLRYLEGNQVIVRTANEDETITTLDGTDRKLDTEMLVIADEKKPVAIAGVMGGEYSGIMEDTNTIVFESACFNGASVRRTSKKLGMRTEASGRFEKQLDPENCLTCLNRALELVQLLNAGDVINGVVDCNCIDSQETILPFDWKWVNNFVGIDVKADAQKEILEKLEFKVENDLIKVPSFRGDVNHLADISEEIARFYGYENIPNRPLSGVANAKLTDEQVLQNLISETLLSCGLSEISTYSFISPKAYNKINLPEDSEKRNCVVITNPLGEDTSVMRTTPLPSLLDVLARNYNNRNENIKVFELATVYFSQGTKKLPVENQIISIGMYGDDCNFYSVKGVVEELICQTGIDSYDIEVLTNDSSLHPGRAAKLLLNGEELATIGEIHPAVLDNYGFDTRVYVALVKFETIQKNRNTIKRYKPLPKFPAINRDLAFVCDKEITVLKLEKTISKAIGDVLESISLFDVYEGEQITQGKKSVAFNIRLRSDERTLKDDEADSAVKRAVEALSELGISLRG